jgi:uncharacterized protein involved in response to NO
MATSLTAANSSPVVPVPPALSPTQIFEITRACEATSSRLLMTFVTTGLIFMVFPGTFLGVWNLLQISGRESVASISSSWLQAHGHAQVFGWVGSFILGIGFYSIPKMRGRAKPSFATAWACWGMWTTGAALRWAANVYLWEWRILLPVSAGLELAAFLIFFRSVSQHRSDEPGKKKLDPWVWVVVSASLGLLSVLVNNAVGCFYVAFRSTTPAFPHVFDQRYLALLAWGFLVPFVWGFSAKWMTVFLGLKPLRTRWLLSAVAVNLGGLGLVVAGEAAIGSWLFVLGAACAIVALRMFESSENEPKIRGVHFTFPFFVRMAYGWLLIAAALGVAATRWDTSGGIWGASRHALTVGFISVMILSVGQRILPAFAGMRMLWSTKLMFVGLAFVTLGCTLRVSCEILAYQGYAAWAWPVLPISALCELAGLAVYAVNILGTFILEPTHSQKETIALACQRASK